MTLTGRTGTAVLGALIVSLCINLLLAGMMIGGRWYDDDDGPRHGRFLGGPIMRSVPDDARPLVKEVFDSHKAEFDTHRDANARAFQEAVQTFPEVVACHMVSGEADFLLEVVVADLAAYDAFLSRTLLKLPMVRGIRSNFAIRTVKSEGSLPVSHG